MADLLSDYELKRGRAMFHLDRLRKSIEHAPNRVTEPAAWAIGIHGVRSGSAVLQHKGEVVMSEGPSNSSSQAQARGLGAGAIASLTGVGLLLIFMFQNTESVRLDFLFWGFTWPLWLLTLASAFLGALVWFGLGVMRRHRRRKERRQERRG